MENKLRSIILFIVIIIMVPSCYMKYCNDLDRTAYNELKASSLLKKYEWFKDASAALDEKRATLQVYEQRFVSLQESYGKDTGRKSWSREDREQWNIWQSEYLGVKASYNSLAAEYNSAMSKVNYSFCNVGSLPVGADVPLPREFKPYITQ